MTHPNAVAYPAIHSVWTDATGNTFTVTNTAAFGGFVFARRNGSTLGTEQRFGIHEWNAVMTRKAALVAA